MSVPIPILGLYLCILSNLSGGNPEKKGKIYIYKSYINFWKTFFSHYLHKKILKKVMILIDNSENFADPLTINGFKTD